MGGDQAFFSVLRLYKNAAGDTIRIDEISISGFFLRKNLFKNWGAARVVDPLSTTPGEPRFTVEDFIFHQNQGRQVSVQLLNLGESRVVSTIDMIGSWLSIGSGPNYQSVVWRGGSIDLSDLPVVTNTV